MRAPGFTADASSYVTGGHYRAAATARPEPGPVPGAVTPALAWYDYACAGACSAACEPAILGGFDAWTSCLERCDSFCTGHTVTLPHVRTILRA
jgi:hypothetical protein